MSGPDNLDGIWRSGDERTLAEAYRFLQRGGLRIPTGFPSLDDAFGRGLVEGTMIAVVGAQSSGKSLFGLSVALEAMSRGYNVGVITLDMQWKLWLLRAMAQIGNLSLRDLLKQEQLDAFDDKAVRAALQKLGEFEGELLLADNARAGTFEGTMETIRTMARYRGKLDRPTKLIVIDFVQRMRDRRWRRTRSEELDDMVHEISQATQELSLVTLLVSQLNREGKKSSRPHLEDSLGGSAIENDCDGGFVIDHNQQKRITPTERLVLARMEKNRVTGETPAWWLRITKSPLGMADGGIARGFEDGQSGNGAPTGSRR